MAYEVKFPFKGDRNYVHGSSLLEELMCFAERRGINTGTLMVSFKRTLYNPLCILTERRPKGGDAVVANILPPCGTSISVCINEAAVIEPAERRAFDESGACDGALMHKNRILQAEIRHFNKPELIIALCKKMHLECVDANKKWVFSRYVGDFPIPDINKIEIRLITKVGLNLTRSDVWINDRNVGRIFFS